MLNEIKTLVTAAYEILTNNKDFMFFKRFKTSKASHNDEFLIHYEDLTQSICNLRSSLTQLSIELENIELTSNKLHSNIERENEKDRLAKEKSRAEKAEKKAEKESMKSVSVFS